MIDGDRVDALLLVEHLAEVLVLRRLVPALEPFGAARPVHVGERDDVLRARATRARPSRGRRRRRPRCSSSRSATGSRGTSATARCRIRRAGSRRPAGCRTGSAVEKTRTCVLQVANRSCRETRNRGQPTSRRPARQTPTSPVSQRTTASKVRLVLRESGGARLKYALIDASRRPAAVRKVSR